jgi:hypothetical protein
VPNEDIGALLVGSAHVLSDPFVGNLEMEDTSVDKGGLPRFAMETFTSFQLIFVVECLGNLCRVEKGS